MKEQNSICSHVIEAIDVGRSGGKSPSGGTEKAKRPRNASGVEDEKESHDSPSSGNDDTDIDAVQADALWVSFVPQRFVVLLFFSLLATV